MAFTLRLDPETEARLDMLCERLDIKARTKAIEWLIDNIDRIESEKKAFYSDLIAAEKKLRDLHNAFSEYRKAELHFRNMTTPPSIIG